MVQQRAGKRTLKEFLIKYKNKLTVNFIYLFKKFLI